MPPMSAFAHASHVTPVRTACHVGLRGFGAAIAPLPILHLSIADTDMIAAPPITAAGRQGAPAVVLAASDIAVVVVKAERHTATTVVTGASTLPKPLNPSPHP